MASRLVGIPGNSPAKEGDGNSDEGVPSRASDSVQPDETDDSQLFNEILDSTRNSSICYTSRESAPP